MWQGCVFLKSQGDSVADKWSLAVLLDPHPEGIQLGVGSGVMVKIKLEVDLP